MFYLLKLMREMDNEVLNIREGEGFLSAKSNDPFPGGAIKKKIFF